MSRPLPSNLPPRGLSREQAAEYVGVSVDVFVALVRDGTVPAGLKLRGRRVWDRLAIDRALDALSGLIEAAPVVGSTGKQAALEAVRGSL